jgi:hypothetical protein
VTTYQVVGMLEIIKHDLVTEICEHNSR